MTFTIEEELLLKNIVQDKYSVGGFSGMIFNAKLAHPDKTDEELIKLALGIRKFMEDSIKKEVPAVPGTPVTIPIHKGNQK